jgi:hypothetical protein
VSQRSCAFVDEFIEQALLALPAAQDKPLDVTSKRVKSYAENNHAYTN